MRDVYVIGAFTTAFKKHPGKCFADLARESYMGALSDAGMKTGADIETGWLGNCGMGFWSQNSGFADRAKRKLVAIHVAGRLEDLRVPPSNHLEKLRGDLEGLYSIRVNSQWRIVFRWDNGDAYDVRVVDYH